MRFWETPVGLTADGKPDYAYLLAGIDLKISRLTHPEVLPVIICRKHGKSACLLNMYTIPAARGMGLAGKILAMLVEHARKEKCCKVFLNASDMGTALPQLRLQRDRQRNGF
ncbi:MAG: GNAT family N-acetyltransferase [Lentisphaerae bacterium]|nr:GNAT family N-acetyltransferase [Lentisphaerota bacterium]